ncbi:F-box protein At2g14710-like [Lycium ferocissimum]|uniref:F-box protein At2g14710-like n=1 Tax=Lycium ferocissimum TaxID=112874 RepID=UPI0028159430|nr:F-box protein At2g14710-like [Lycium ferocissimum]
MDYGTRWLEIANEHVELALYLQNVYRRQQLLEEAELSKDYSKNGDLPLISICLDSLYFSSLKCQEEENERPPAFEDDKSIFSCDILFGILVWLPVKSLLRFQSVSKPWNAIISDNEFKKTHRDQSKALGREKLLLDHMWKGVFEFRDLESSQLILMEKQKFPLKNPVADKHYVLWNPSTGKYRALSCPDNHLYYNDKPRNVSAYGLCYESSVGDYKTTKTSFPCPVLPVGGNCGSSGISTEGCVFWSLNRRKPFIDKASTIIYFDVKSNEVEKLPTPDLVGEKDFFRLTSLKGCLSLYGGRIERKQLDIWIMEQDGSWK